MGGPGFHPEKAPFQGLGSLSSTHFICSICGYKKPERPEVVLGSASLWEPWPPVLSPQEQKGAVWAEGAQGPDTELVPFRLQCRTAGVTAGQGDLGRAAPLRRTVLPSQALATQSIHHHFSFETWFICLVPSALSPQASKVGPDFSNVAFHAIPCWHPLHHPPRLIFPSSPCHRLPGHLMAPGSLAGFPSCPQAGVSPLFTLLIRNNSIALSY